ncbi:MAG: nitrogen fixation negative regulator NifL [Hydrogenophilus sp.]|nr:nitrogen fixation negative regulator NifL [Hydrogenophilus sp.]
MKERGEEQRTLPLEVFREVVEQADVAISITDREARILYTNPAFERMTGYAREEVVGCNQSILSYRVTPKVVYETMWAHLTRQRPWSGALVNRRKDGSRYVAELVVTPVVNASGETAYYVGIQRDATELYRLERQVQNQKALIESVVDSAQVGIVLLDPEERVVLDNQAYKRWIGELGEEPARTLLNALREQYGAEAMKGSFSQREVTVEMGEGTHRYFSCSGSWIEEKDLSADGFYESEPRSYLLLTIEEITALKNQQEMIRLNGLQALLAEQERIQSLREALAGAVYQLQEPFNRLAAAVRVYERRLERQEGKKAAEDPLLKNLQEALAAGIEALERLRNGIPHAEEEPQPVNLNELLGDLLRLTTHRLLAEGIVVEWQPETTLPAVVGRRRSLINLFKQLLDNAIEAIHEARPSRRVIRLATRVFEDCVEVEVADSGPGIPPELRFKVFEPFFTTRRRPPHVGMGLTMAQEVVAQHGGLIEIDPEYQTGCRMVVHFPRRG